jgi:hypothetical protein
MEDSGDEGKRGKENPGHDQFLFIEDHSNTTELNGNPPQRQVRENSV